MKKMLTINNRQANHHSYILPEELKGTSEKKLYMNVAIWAMKQGHMVCSQSIAKNFGISTRQASNILSLIQHRYSDVIQVRVKKVKEDGIIRNYIQVIAIKPKSRKTVSRCANYPANNDKNLHHWKSVFLSARRKNSEGLNHPATLCDRSPISFKINNKKPARDSR